MISPTDQQEIECLQAIIDSPKAKLIEKVLAKQEIKRIVVEANNQKSDFQRSFAEIFLNQHNRSTWNQQP